MGSTCVAPEERAARKEFVGGGVTVVGRAALEHVADEHLVPAQPHGANDVGQLIAGLAHERGPLAILVKPRRLADEDQPGVGIALTEDGLSTCLRQSAPCTPLDLALIEETQLFRFAG